MQFFAQKDPGLSYTRWNLWKRIRSHLSNSLNKSVQVIIAIYVFYLIPQIFDSYQKNKNKFDSTEKNSFLADLAIEVVKQILARNNLTKDDL